MNVDKFGRQSKSVHGAIGKPGIGFLLDINGNYSLQNKRITKLSDPIDDTDACNKNYIDNLYSELSKQISELKSINTKTDIDYNNNNKQLAPKSNEIEVILV